MPSEPAPKKWKAARGFTYRHVHYAIGDPVTDRRTIAAQLDTGRITVDRSRKTAEAETPEPEQEN